MYNLKKLFKAQTAHMAVLYGFSNQTWRTKLAVSNRKSSKAQIGAQNKLRL